MKQKTDFWIYSLAIIVVFLIPFSGCKKADNSSPEVFNIGQIYDGGIIFYIDGTGQHGLIAATSDQSTGIKWGIDNMDIVHGTLETIGSGKANTLIIVKAYDSLHWVIESAAYLCNDLTLNGYDDWFLPSKEELNLMYQRREIIGGFTENLYWSSTQGDVSTAWHQYFGSGNGKNWTKSYKDRVRAIRAF
jgi:hypothetical protein